VITGPPVPHGESEEKGRLTPGVELSRAAVGILEVAARDYVVSCVDLDECECDQYTNVEVGRRVRAGAQLVKDRTVMSSSFIGVVRGVVAIPEPVPGMEPFARRAELLV